VRARSEGFGLAGMRERAGLAGGTLWFESGEGGTLVRARLPLQPSIVGTRSLELDAEEMAI
jgi:signal transduction histidine kinase